MEKIISVIGLTSSGKSSLGIALAKKFNGEIVSADSRQVYKGLDFCSGKVSKQEQFEVPHHLIDVQNLGKQFTLYDYQTKAYAAIDNIISRHKVPFLVGGTGLYSRSVVEGYDLSPISPNEKLRAELETKSLNELKEICLEKNISCEGEQTKRRLIRQIETSLNQKSPNKPKYKVLQIGIFYERADIYKRIGIRLKERLKNMIAEISQLLRQGEDKEFLKSLGLEAKYVIKFLDGEFSSEDELFEELFKEERHFAKRQQTWYNKEQNVVWLNASKLSEENLKKEATKLVSEFLEQN